MSGNVLSGTEVRSILGGVPIAWPAAVVIKSLGDIGQAINDVRSFPVVVKAEGLAHRHASGGVWTGVRDRDALVASVRAFGLHFGFPITVTPYLQHNTEYILGVTRYQTGECLAMVGIGGTAVEARDQTIYLLLPVARREAVQAVLAFTSEIHQAGQLADAMIALGEVMVADGHKRYGSIDLNPVVFDEGGGTLYALDAKVFLADSVP